MSHKSSMTFLKKCPVLCLTLWAQAKSHQPTLMEIKDWFEWWFGGKYTPGVNIFLVWFTYVIWILSLRSKKGLPWWRSGWESACQCRGHGFVPWSGKIPHAAEQLGPWATTAEPARLEPVPRNKRGRDSKRPAHRDEKWPPLAATRESPRTETKTQHSQK